jgi:hypothetical protein
MEGKEKPKNQEALKFISLKPPGFGRVGESKHHKISIVKGFEINYL